MKQSILKKPSHFFCDGADSSISSINGANFGSVARSTDTEGSQVKNVRFLDLIQQAPSTLDSPRTETSLNYINFQRFSSSSTNSFSSPHSGLNRRPKTSIGLKTFNVFSGHENQGKLDDDDPLTAYSAQRASALSFTLKNPTQTPQTSSQLQQSQHDLLRRALRISSASIENRSFHHSVRPIDSTPIPLPRQQPQTHDESKQHSTVEQDDTSNQHSSTQQQHHHQPESLTSSSNFQSPSLLSLSSNFHPINYRVKKLETSQHPQNAQTSDQQQQQTAATMNHRPVVKPRISSASSSSTYSTNNNTNSHSATTAATPIATTVYFPSSNQYLNIQSAPLSSTTATTTNRVGSASRVTSASNNSNGGGRAVMTTNLALYTYLLQANKTLAKEMRASVIRSQAKNGTDLNDSSTVSYIAGTNDDNSPMISSGNRAIYSIPFPGVKEKTPNTNSSNNGTRNNLYRSSTSLRKRTPVPTSKVNYRISNSATLRRNANLINSKYSSN